jgi:hypothetical protein
MDTNIATFHYRPHRRTDEREAVKQSAIECSGFLFLIITVCKNKTSVTDVQIFKDFFF